jgi:hypothetical protein
MHIHSPPATAGSVTTVMAEYIESAGAAITSANVGERWEGEDRHRVTALSGGAPAT